MPLLIFRATSWAQNGGMSLVNGLHLLAQWSFPLTLCMSLASTIKIPGALIFAILMTVDSCLADGVIATASKGRLFFN